VLTYRSFLTDTLNHHPRGESVARILAAALQAVEPGAAVRRFVERRGDALWINGRMLKLERGGRIAILGIGKAALAMTQPLVEMLADRSPRGVLIPKHEPPQTIAGFDIQPGGHPIPDENSLAAGRKALALAGALQAQDVLICLISGGGSALMSAPYAGISLQDLRALTSALLASGARIDEINTLRRHLDLLKGGGLARAAQPARVVSLILSDVVDNPLEAIASGPTAPDPSTRQAGLAILEKYGLVEKTALPVLNILRSGPETPKIGDEIFERVENVIVGSNRLALDAALEQAGREGFQTRSLGSAWQGEARDVAAELCQLLKNSAGESADKRPFCLAAGGETTVTLRASSGAARGRGGRNLELALEAVCQLAGQADMLLVSLATDGEDGPTDAAGAVASGDTLEKGKARGLWPQAFLENNDSYTYFDGLNDLLKPGPSGTNVNDLTFLFGF
jgi:hydroxypyruvate reductase